MAVKIIYHRHHIIAQQLHVTMLISVTETDSFKST